MPPQSACVLCWRVRAVPQGGATRVCVCVWWHPPEVGQLATTCTRTCASCQLLSSWGQALTGGGVHLQQNGAVSSSQHEEGRSRAFMGSGYSLSGDSSAPVERNEDEKKIRHTITMWSNGFTVDDGPLRRTVRLSAWLHPNQLCI